MLVRLTNEKLNVIDSIDIDSETLKMVKKVNPGVRKIILDYIDAEGPTVLNGLQSQIAAEELAALMPGRDFGPSVTSFLEILRRAGAGVHRYVVLSP